MKQESKVAHQLRMDRIAYVQALCESQKIKIVLLRDRRIRNTLTHIDERLADILTEKKNAKWFIDVTIDPSEWQTVKPFEDTIADVMTLSIKRSYILDWSWIF